ncbi:MAG: hypothetical protein HYY06_27095 [Deltaproteobacteria bacterium]|nr:hypothetical protein [Deltaproteobacteria bacterium]
MRVGTALVLSFALAGCGARSGLLFARGAEGEDAGRDASTVGRDASTAGPDAALDGGLDAAADAGLDASGACVPVDPRCGQAEICGNGDDDDCDGRVDEDCPCEPGRVQACFPGPPGNRGVGVCTDGAQTCEKTATWGPCTDAIVPREDVCNGADNLCTGCSEQRDCPILCPSPGDERVPVGAPMQDYPLWGRDFYTGPVRSWRWTAEGGPCDDIAPNLVSFDLDGADGENATFYPMLSGDYTIGLEVTTANGTVLDCEWIVHVAGPGLRVEMCYPESEEQDLDLFLHRPNTDTPWYPEGANAFQPLGGDSCGWHNCEATIRGEIAPGIPVARVDWGYEWSEIEECGNGPHGAEWRALGACANPRLDIDNNLAKASGVPENINVDVPGDGETFRIMVQNFSGELAHPLVNVYCAGQRVATYGAPPDEVEDFEGATGYDGIGAMWRVADVTTFVIPEDGTIDCDVAAVHPPGQGSGYDVTYEDPRY